MRLFLFQLLGLTLLLQFSALGQSESKDSQTLRVATYNIRNYLSMDRRIDNRFRREYPKPETEKNVVRETILKVSPELLALQEVGTLEYLLELKSDLAREGLRYENYAIVRGQDDVRHVAAMWTENLDFEVVEHVNLEFNYFDSPTSVKRGMLELKSTKDFDLSVFVLHLKSKYTNDKRDFQSENRRTLEAQAVRNRILDIFPDPAVSKFMVVGDLNDTPDSRALARLLKRGDREISRILPATDLNGLIWTHFYKRGGSYSLVDYVLLSPGLWVDQTVRGMIENPENYYQGSDHRLVWVDLPLSD